MAAGRAAANAAGASETNGRVAKDTFLVSLPGAGVRILPGVGVEGAMLRSLRTVIVHVEIIVHSF